MLQMESFTELTFEELDMGPLDRSKSAFPPIQSNQPATEGDTLANPSHTTTIVPTHQETEPPTLKRKKNHPLGTLKRNTLRKLMEKVQATPKYQHHLSHQTLMTCQAIYKEKILIENLLLDINNSKQP